MLSDPTIICLIICDVPLISYRLYLFLVITQKKIYLTVIRET